MNDYGMMPVLDNLLCVSDNIVHYAGGFEYKKTIVDTIISVIEDNPEAKEAGLAHLCEFIEDCEHTGI